MSTSDPIKNRWIGYCSLGIIIDVLVFVIFFGKGISWNAAHVFSFLIASAAMLLFRIFWPYKETFGISGGDLLRFAIIQLFALFLRGGVLAALVESANLFPTLALVPSAFVSSLVTLAGANFWLLQTHNKQPGKHPGWNQGLTAIMVYAAALRLIYSWTFELLHEEAYYWNYGQHLDIGYLDHPPMVGWLIWFFTSLFGQTEFVVRLSSLTCWVAAAYFMYKLTHAACGAAAAFRMLFLAVVLPLFFGTALVITPDAPLVACWAGALYYLYWAVIKESRCSWLGVGVCMGLGLLSKYTIVLLGVSLVMFLLIDRPARKWFLRLEPYLGLIIAIALFSPVIVWNARQNWASFGFQSTKRLTGDFDFALPELAGSALLLLTPAGVLAVFTVIIAKQYLFPKPVTGETSRTHRLLLTTTLIPFAIFFFLSLFRLSKLNWTAPIWLGALPYIALSMTADDSSILPGNSLAERLLRDVRSAWPAMILVFLILYGLIFHYTVLGLPGVPYPNDLVGIGIPDLARQVGAIEKEFETQHGQKPFIVCMDADRFAGWIAFYRIKMTGADRAAAAEFINNTTGGHLFEKDSHMYRFWHPVETYDKARPLLILTEKREYLLKDQVLAHIEPMSEIKAIVLQKHGKSTTTFFYQFAKLREI